MNALKSQITLIEQAALRAWPPRETADLTGWLLRSGGGSSRRLNSAATQNFHGTNINEAIEKAEQWYLERRSPPCFHLTEMFEPQELDAELEARKYESFTKTDVMTSQIAPASDPAHDIVLESHASAMVMDALFDPLWSAAIRRDRAALFARIKKPYTFAIATIEGEPVAGGLCVVDDGLAGIFSMRTKPEMRRKGLAGSILGKLSKWAEGIGTEQLYLQVEQENYAACALYQSRGFVKVYSYHYRQKDTDRAGKV